MSQTPGKLDVCTTDNGSLPPDKKADEDTVGCDVIISSKPPCVFEMVLRTIVSPVIGFCFFYWIKCSFGKKDIRLGPESQFHSRSNVQYDQHWWSPLIDMCIKCMH